MRGEELDDLAPLRGAAPRTEAETLLDPSATMGAARHRPLKHFIGADLAAPQRGRAGLARAAVLTRSWRSFALAVEQTILASADLAAPHRGRAGLARAAVLTRSWRSFALAVEQTILASADLATPHRGRAGLARAAVSRRLLGVESARTPKASDIASLGARGPGTD